ncbi:multidrug ABC transporter permease [Betaproteobacteria bacterium UKL13-2]|jgi:ABC-type antimicrobial peptide transport system permease subunit|nr:multidrug ABC transporter permease [Betaproteobacteria bacterium UKL13-2]HCG52794.1 multidrug ABC transporter permease [Betaproteobacteria bacterium]
MKIPFSYIFRNLWTRKLTTILTAAGMGLVVFVFSAVLMLDAGLKKTMVGTGSLDNVLAIRTGSETEIQSGITRDQAGLLGAMPQVARSKSGDPMVSKESLVLISLTKSGQEKGSNVVARGVSPMGITLRPQVKLIEGRMFRPGSSELVVGRNINREFNGAEIGQSLRFAQRDWVIVGVFDGGGSAFDSEIWGDVEQLMQAFRRLNYSSVIMQLAQQDSFESLLKEIAAEVRLTLDVKREQIFYEDQSRALSTFISILGNVLTVIFSIGAIIGAAITMYSSVAMRTAEIGTLRALGFRRPSILVAFLGESLLLGLVGGLAGLFFASFLQAITISTLNFQSFSQLAFSFTLTPKIVVQTLVFSMFMGFVGGFLPAMRAARMKIVDSLRAA